MSVTWLFKSSSISILIPFFITLLAFAYSTESSAARKSVDEPNQAAIISGTTNRSVTEDYDPDGDNLLEVNGKLNITDSDAGEAAFIAKAINGNYGGLTIITDGNWSYAADNSQAIIQNLTATDTLTDNLTVSSVDGTTQTVAIKIVGVDELNQTAIISGTTNRTVTEDYDPDGDNLLEVNGKLNITDSDAGEAAFIAKAINGNYGGLTIKTDGNWSYSANNSQAIIQNLTATDILTDNLTVSSVDGTPQTIAIKIVGVDETNETAAMLTPIVDVIITPEDVKTQDLRDIVASYSENTRFLIKAGMYRMQTIKPKRGMVFYGDVDTNGKRHTILNGSKLLTNFGQAGGLYFVTDQTQQRPTQGVTEDGWEASKHPEDLFFDDVALQQVLTKSEVASGKWYFDYANDTIWFANNPSGKKVETSVTAYAIAEDAPKANAIEVTIKGFIVEKYANRATSGAIGGSATFNKWHVEYNLVRLNHGTGIKVVDDSVIKNNTSHYNGQIGIKVQAKNVLIQGNEVSFNNTMHFARNWDAGGIKVAGADNIVIKDNNFNNNYGRGVWVDNGTHFLTIDNNIIKNNFDEGVHIEVSYNGMITNNKIAHNAQSGDWTVRNWVTGGNIFLSTSTDMKVENNTIIVNKDFGNGITAAWGERYDSYASDINHTPPLRVENLLIQNNDITYLGLGNRKVGVNGDILPPKTGGATPSSGVNEYDASGTIDGVAPDANIVVSDVSITEVRLNNIFDNNTYHIPQGIEDKLWFRWDSALSFTGFQATSNELNSIIDNAVVDDSAEWTPLVTNDFSTFLEEVIW